MIISVIILLVSRRQLSFVFSSRPIAEQRRLLLTRVKQHMHLYTPNVMDTSFDYLPTPIKRKIVVSWRSQKQVFSWRIQVRFFFISISRSYGTDLWGQQHSDTNTMLSLFHFSDWIWINLYISWYICPERLPLDSKRNSISGSLLASLSNIYGQVGNSSDHIVVANVSIPPSTCYIKIISWFC